MLYDDDEYGQIVVDLRTGNLTTRRAAVQKLLFDQGKQPPSKPLPPETLELIFAALADTLTRAYASNLP
jgi:hypothetical protein